MRRMEDGTPGDRKEVCVVWGGGGHGGPSEGPSEGVEWGGEDQELSPQSRW